MNTLLIEELFLFYLLDSFDASFAVKTLEASACVLNASAWLARTRVGAYLSLHYTLLYILGSVPRLKEAGNQELSAQEKCSCHTEALTSAGGKEQKSSRNEAAPLSAFLLSQAHAP